MGVLQRLQKQYDKALANFEKALIIKPDFIDALTYITLVYIAKDELDKAIIRCDRNLEKTHDKPEIAARVYNLKGQIYLAQDNIPEAKNSYTMALEKDPDFLAPYHMLATIYLLENRQEQAIAQYQKILEKNPNQARPHMILGTIYDLQQRFDLSEIHYRNALRINPEFGPAANNLAYILATHNKNIDEALGFAQVAKEQLPDDPYVMDTLGWIYYHKGFYDFAIVEFSDSLEKIPENPIFTYHLGMAYYKKGDRKKARAELEKALRLDESFAGADEARKVLAEL